MLNEIPKDKFLLIAGPCAIEGEEIALKIAEKLISITSKLSLPLVFKGSYRNPDSHAMSCKLQKSKQNKT